MSPERQRIAIAEACSTLRWLDNRIHPTDTPDYLNDLNAMHKAEETLTYEQLHEYVHQLAVVHMQTTNRNDWDYLAFVHIPANERAEAFLRTIGKWKDAPMKKGADQ